MASVERRGMTGMRETETGTPKTACGINWGSHGCHDPDARHQGDHWCIDEGETHPHSRVGLDGLDRETGFQWDLWGDDADGYPVGETLDGGERVTVWFRNTEENWQAVSTQFRITDEKRLPLGGETDGADGER